MLLQDCASGKDSGSAERALLFWSVLLRAIRDLVAETRVKSQRGEPDKSILHNESFPDLRLWYVNKYSIILLNILTCCLSALLNGPIEKQMIPPS